jgi:hypothetical protein
MAGAVSKSERLQNARAWMLGLRELAQEWRILEAEPMHGMAQTSAYIDLIFAFGLARLGSADETRTLRERAALALGERDEAHQFLWGAYEYRIQQALDGKPHTGPLLREQMEYLDYMERLPRYVVDRLHKHSRILNPDERINPYRHWGARIGNLEKSLAELTDLTDRAELSRRVDKLLDEAAEGARGIKQRAKVLCAGLEAAPRVSEEFARRLLNQVAKAYNNLPKPKDLPELLEQATFLEKALFVAAHFQAADILPSLLDCFEHLCRLAQGSHALATLDALINQCFKSLRQLNLCEELDQRLQQVADWVLQGKNLGEIPFESLPHGPRNLRILLSVAAGQYAFGWDSLAAPVLEQTRQVLFRDNLVPREQTTLACAYAETLGEAPPEITRPRLEEIFRQLRGIRDTYTTSSHFSVSQLDVIEAVVLAGVEAMTRP